MRPAGAKICFPSSWKDNCSDEKVLKAKGESGVNWNQRLKEAEVRPHPPPEHELLPPRAPSIQIQAEPHHPSLKRPRRLFLL